MTAITPRGEVTPAIPDTLPTARAWLYGYVRSDHPGYRSLRVAGLPVTVASTTGKRWDSYVADLSTALTSTASWTATLGGDGRVTLAGSSSIISYPDRLGWLLGMGLDAGTSESTATTSRASRFVPPAGIPLYGAQWDSVSVEREREIVMDRSRRQGGYVWGGARVWRWTLTLHRWSLDALLTGWCLRGQVAIVGAGVSSPMSSSEPGGSLTGHALGLDGAPVWGGPTQQFATVRLLVAGSST